MLLESFDGIYPKHASYKPTLRIINKLDGSSEEILRMVPSMELKYCLNSDSTESSKVVVYGQKSHHSC